MKLYSNVARVRLVATIRRSRRLSVVGEVLTPVGLDVNAVQVVARSAELSGFQIIQASEHLKIVPEKLANYLLVEAGTVVQKGTPLIRKPGLFGRSKIYRSPVNGYLNQIIDGCLVIQYTNEVTELRAGLPGRVVSIIPERGVVIEATGAVVQAIWDSGKDGYGRLVAVTQTPADGLPAGLAGGQVRATVLVAGIATDLAEMQALENEGVRGLIVGSLPAGLIPEVEKLAYPVFVTEGIGIIPMATPIFDLLRQSAGREVALLAASGGPRPQPAEIVIPLPTSGRVETSQEALTIGATVRVIDLQGQVNVGKVLRLHQQPLKHKLGYSLPGAEVVLANGDTMYVPYPNMEILHS